MAQHELENKRLENLQQILNVHDQPLVRNTEPFTCPICFEDIQPGVGIMLRDCLHTFCELVEVFVVSLLGLQCFDAVGWVSGRASGP